MDVPIRVLIVVLFFALIPHIANAGAVPQGEASQGTSSVNGAGLILQPTRTITFETEEGTNMSVDVSPDGRTIVFDLLGDLYTLPIEGGEARRISSGMAFDFQPRFSPDGERIVFVSDRNGAQNLWTVDPKGGSPQMLTRQAGDGPLLFIGPTWTPDGEAVFFECMPGYNSVSTIHSVPASGGAYRDEVGGACDTARPDDEAQRRASLSPTFTAGDSRYLYFAQSPAAFFSVTVGREYAEQFPNLQVVRLDRESGVVYNLTARYEGGFSPAVSPDGRWLVYASRNDAETGLRLRDLHSPQADRWLILPVERDRQEGRRTEGMLPHYAFTPDSKALITSVGGKIWWIDVPSGDRRLIPFRAHVERQLGPLLRARQEIDDGPVRVRHLRDARSSPDGQQLAFTALQRIWVMELPSGTPRRLTSGEFGSEGYPVWSPDGRSIIFANWTDHAGGHLYRAAADGRGQPAQLTADAAYYSWPQFTPDGSQLVVIRGRLDEELMVEGPFSGWRRPAGGATGESLELRLLPAMGGESSLITPVRRGSQARPHFTSDPSRVYYVEDGGSLLVSVRLDGRARQEHVKISGIRFPRDPRSRMYSEPGGRMAPSVGDIVLSPDGTQVLAEVGAQTFWIDLGGPSGGDGERMEISVASPPPGVRVKQLSTSGGLYPSWHDGGRGVLYSLGTTVFVHEVSENSGPGPVAAYEARIEVPRPRPKAGAVVLQGARIISMRGAEVIERGDVVIEGNRILAVYREGERPEVRDAQTLDVTGMTIVPGFVDTHCHGIGGRSGPEREQPWVALNLLAYGVTTCHNPSTGFDSFTDVDRLDLGEMLGPRFYTSGQTLRKWEPVRSLDDARNLVRRNSRYYRTGAIKVYWRVPRLERQLIAQAIAEEQLTAYIEPNDLSYNLNHLLDGYAQWAHAVEVAPFYQDVIQLMVRSGTGLDVQLIRMDNSGGPSAMWYYLDREDVFGDRKLRRFMPLPRIKSRALRRWSVHEREYVHPLWAQTAGSIVDAGGIVSTGDHAEWMGLGYHWGIWTLASGADNHTALRIATEGGVRVLGLEHALGTVDAGKLADLVVLEGNPLEDIRRTNEIRYVIKNGEIYEASTLEQIWPERKPPPALWWSNELDMTP